MQQYNAQGKVIRSTDLAGRVTTTGWDRGHKTYEGGATNLVRYAYDTATGRLSGMRLGDATSNWGSGILSAPEFSRVCWSGYDPSSSYLYNTYNGENRPVRWTKGNAVITMSYDRMGRRVTKNDQRFVYNGYLQIANFHSQPQPSTSTSFFIWDPTEKIAMRPRWRIGDDLRRSRSAPGEDARTAERKGFRIPSWKIDDLYISLIGTLSCANETYESVAGCMQIVGTTGGLQIGVGLAKKGAFGVGVIF